jgi:FlaA1/EpsC-like NDP-sugar epimerase
VNRLDSWRDAKILVTGGTGSFGNAFIRMTAPHVRRIIVFSRDEMKQNEMRKRLPGVDYFLGDVRDAGRLRRAFDGVDVVIHAAALKIVPAGEYDPEEFIKTNVQGSCNVIDAALWAGVLRVVALSTDKAVNPVNLYGATKLTAERAFIAANSYSKPNGPVFSVVRYGNVMGSRGSVIPLFMEQAAKGGPITITNPEMTRFMITLEQAVELVWDAMNGEAKIHVPRLPAMKVKDIADIVAPGVPQTIVGTRPGEKMHEALDPFYTSDNPERWFEPWELKEWLTLNYGPSQSPTPTFSTIS